MTDDVTLARCDGCHQPVEWVITEANHKRMPIDPDPIADGNLVKLATPCADGTEIVRYLTKAELANEGGSLFEGPTDRYVSHFATYSHADRFRKKGARRA